MQKLSSSSAPCTHTIGVVLFADSFNMKNSLFLMFVASMVSIPLSIVVGAVAARRRDKGFDSATSGINLILAGAAFLGLGKFTAGVIDSFKPLFDLLVKMGSELGSANPQFFEMAGNIAGAASQINLLAGGINSMLPAFAALLGLVLLLSGTSASAQVSLTAFGSPVATDFNGLPTSGSATWTNNATVSGWFYARTGTGTTI